MEMDDKIRKALEEASPVQNTLKIEAPNAFLLGNGDLTALFMGTEDEVVIHVSKNDVWDKRLITAQDADIITDAQVREAAMNTPHGERSLVVNLDSNQPISGKSDCYDYPYPGPVICAKLKMKVEMFSAEHKLNLATASVESLLQTGEMTCYISRNENLLFLEGLREENRVELIPVHHADMENPILTEREKCQVLLQCMPGDPDVPAYWYGVGIRRVNASKLAACVWVAEDADHALTGVICQLHQYGEDDSVYDRHKKAWEEYWSRSYVELDDKLLQNVWYRNTYALGCVARSGCVSPGLFCSNFRDADIKNWHGDYHNNYNYQANFWGAYITNHCDLTDVYDDTIIANHKRAKWIAKQVWNVEGACYPLCLFHGEPEDPEKCVSKNRRQFFHHVWSRTLGLSAMIVQNLLFHWYYDPSEELLHKIYPVIRDVADFYVNVGDLRQALTVSPEHWGITPQLFLNHECTFDIAFIKYLMKGCIKAAKTLGIDEDKCRNWQEYLDDLPEYPTNAGYAEQKAAGAEFYEKDMGKCAWNVPIPLPDAKVFVDVKNAPPIEYNIPAPVLPVFPGCDIDLASSEEERKLACDSIQYMRTNGHNDFIMSAVSRVRMGTADMYSYLQERLAAQVMPSGFIAMCRDNVLPYNSYGIYMEMLGITLAISEMMLQSNKGFIRLFPAMPEGKDGQFCDLLAEGGILVSAERRDGKLVSAIFRPRYNGLICVCFPKHATGRLMCDGQRIEGRTFRNEGGEVITEFMGYAGRRYSYECEE